MGHESIKKFFEANLNFAKGSHRGTGGGGGGRGLPYINMTITIVLNTNKLENTCL